MAVIMSHLTVKSPAAAELFGLFLLKQSALYFVIFLFYAQFSLRTGVTF